MTERTSYAQQDKVEERRHRGEVRGAAEDSQELIDQFVTGPMTGEAATPLPWPSRRP
jgi:hypothetical protein